LDADCCAGECITSAGSQLLRFCAPSCNDANDCPDGPEDGPPASCFVYCNLGCAQGQACPSGMVCNGIHCGWL
jgi:hypothetical protein